jgi:hypothetical protein
MEYVIVKAPVTVWLDDKVCHSKLVQVKKLYGWSLENAQELKRINESRNGDNKVFVQHVKVTDL